MASQGFVASLVVAYPVGEAKVHECFACVEALDGCVDEYEAAVAALE